MRAGTGRVVVYGCLRRRPPARRPVPATSSSRSAVLRAATDAELPFGPAVDRRVEIAGAGPRRGAPPAPPAGPSSPSAVGAPAGPEGGAGRRPLLCRDRRLGGGRRPRRGRGRAATAR